MSTLHAVLATVSDQPGMLFGLTRVLADHRANIRYVDMHATGTQAEVYLEFSLEGAILPVVGDLPLMEPLVAALLPMVLLADDNKF